jgi:acetyltransferase-like isoleucine patch superfamily enzyme
VSAKDDLLRQARALWEGADFRLRDGERQRKLRPDILRRMLGLVMTDDERAAAQGLHETCRMREGAKIISPEKFECGEYVWIGENAVLDASGGLSVGSHTSIGLGVYIWSHTSQLTNLTMQNFSGSALIERKPTKIGSGVFIAGPSVVLAGVSIGDKCVIAPLTVVTKDIPPYSVVLGNPGRIVKTMDEEYIAAERARVLGQGGAP